MEMVLRRDKVLVLGGLVFISALAWGYTVYVAQSQGSMGTSMAIAMPNMSSWSPVDWASMFVMWAVMMIAMMVPTAAPMILLFASVNRRRKEQGRPFVPTAIFASGYIIAWAGFAAIATAGNWVLHTHGLLSSMMGASNSHLLGGLLLIAAGLFQWTPVKYACLTHCRSPLGFLMTEWQDGPAGALRMGLRHGSYCVGCCWVLMALLFVLGVMNLAWVAALAGFVLVEKVAPRGQLISRVTGILLVVWGGIVLSGVLWSPVL